MRKNVIFERARFNRRNQLEGESAESYITTLYELAEYCEYGALKTDLIRDRLVVGIRDNALSEHLQTKEDLTLEKAKTMIRQREAMHEQQSSLKETADEPSSVVALIHYKKGQGQNKRSCMRCGRESHPRDKCPARDAICHRCKRKGHYGIVCRSKTIANTIEATADSIASLDMDTAFLDNLTPSNQGAVQWSTSIQVNTAFKLDTGAEVTAVCTDTHQRLMGLPGNLCRW